MLNMCSISCEWLKQHIHDETWTRKNEEHVYHSDHFMLYNNNDIESATDLNHLKEIIHSLVDDNTKLNEEKKSFTQKIEQMEANNKKELEEYEAKLLKENNIQ